MVEMPVMAAQAEWAASVAMAALREWVAP